MAITVVLALAAGIYTAANHNKLGDVGVMSLTQIGIALPNFWFAILLILLFSVKLQLLSAGGFAGWDDGIWPGIKSLLLPADTWRKKLGEKSDIHASPLRLVTPSITQPKLAANLIRILMDEAFYYSL